MKRLLLIFACIFLSLPSFSQSRNKLIRVETGGWAYLRVLKKDNNTEIEAFNTNIPYKAYQIEDNSKGFYGFSLTFFHSVGYLILDKHSISAIPFNQIDTTKFTIEMYNEPYEYYTGYWLLKIQGKGEEDNVENYSYRYWAREDLQEDSENSKSIWMFSKDKKALEQVVKDVKKAVKAFYAYANLPKFWEGFSPELPNRKACDELIANVEKIHKILGKSEVFDMTHYQLDIYKCKVLRGWAWNFDNNLKTEEEIRKYFDAVQEYKKYAQVFKNKYEALVKERCRLAEDVYRLNSAGSFQLRNDFETYTKLFQQVPEDFATLVANIRGEDNKNKTREMGNATDAKGYSGLQRAIMNKDYEKVKSFIDAGSDLEFKNNQTQETVVEVAAMHASPEFFSELLSIMRKKYDIDKVKTSIYWAASKNLKTISPDNLEICLGYSSINVVLYYRQPEINSSDQGLLKLLKIRQYRIQDVYYQKTIDEGKTFLMYAIEKNDFPMVKMIIDEMNSDYYNQIDKDGMTALMMAARDGRKDMVKFMHEKGFNPFVRNERDYKKPIDYTQDKDIKKMLKDQMKKIDPKYKG